MRLQVDIRTHCSALQHMYMHTLHHTAQHCTTLHHTAPRCNTLTHCNIQHHMNMYPLSRWWEDHVSDEVSQAHSDSLVQIQFASNFPFERVPRDTGKIRVSRFIVAGYRRGRISSGNCHIDWCCFYYVTKHSLVALLEALFARKQRVPRAPIHRAASETLSPHRDEVSTVMKKKKNEASTHGNTHICTDCPDILFQMRLYGV